MPKKRKYTRKKIKKSIFQIKYLILFLVSLWIIHFFHVNISPFFKNITQKDVLIVYANQSMNWWKLDQKDLNYLSKNISYFSFTQPRKILVLWENSKLWNQTETITDFLLNNDIWWGNIAQEISRPINYWTITHNFITTQNLDDALVMSNLWNYYKNISYFQTEKYPNISIKLYYDWLSDIFLGSLKNYYYFWKK